MRYRIKDLAQHLGISSDQDAWVSSIVTDTRKLTPGSCFVALLGPNFNGHDFIQQAFDRGALCAIVSEPNEDPRCLLVEDTLKALTELASYHRQNWPGTMLAITGSMGKTSVTQMTSQIMKAHLGDEKVHTTQKNDNNTIGVAQTLLALRDEHTFAIVEAGTNQKGEINKASEMIHPDYAVVLNVAASHLEGLASLEGVAREKGALYAGLKDQGIAFINEHDAHLKVLKNAIGHRSSYSICGPNAPASLEIMGLKDHKLWVKLTYGSSSAEIFLKQKCHAFVMNAAMVANMAYHLSVPFEVVQAVLTSIEGVEGRMKFYPLKDRSNVLFDAYNANPGSMKMALSSLEFYQGPYDLVIGSMAELGADSGHFHQEIAEIIKHLPFRTLWVVGEEAKIIADHCGGLFFDHVEDLLALWQKGEGLAENADGTLLVKGSFSMNLKKLLPFLLGEKI